MTTRVSGSLPVPLKAVQELMGHATIEMTLRSRT